MHLLVVVSKVHGRLLKESQIPQPPLVEGAPRLALGVQLERRAMNVAERKSR